LNVSHIWSGDELADLTILDKPTFLTKYPWISPTAYRQRKAVVEKTPQQSVVTVDGTYHPETWNYATSRPIVPDGAEKHVMIGDTHGVFVDQRVWASVLDFVRDFKPDAIHLMGDIADFYDISRFSKDPTRRVMLAKEIDFTKTVILAEIRRAAGQKCKIDWIEGNHEERLQKYLWRQAPELAGVPSMEMEALFDMNRYGISYVRGNITVGDLQLTHGNLVRKHSGYTAKAMLDDYGMSVMHNHTHRLGSVYKTDRSGEYVAYENGCLCRTDLDYVDHPNWQHGFSVGWVLPTGRFHIQQIAVVDGRFVFDGKFYGKQENA